MYIYIYVREYLQCTYIYICMRIYIYMYIYPARNWNANMGMCAHGTAMHEQARTIQPLVILEKASCNYYGLFGIFALLSNS